MERIITLLSVVLLVSCTPSYDLEKDYCGGMVVEIKNKTFSNSGSEFTVLMDSTYYQIDLPEHYVRKYEIGDRLCEESRREKN